MDQDIGILALDQLVSSNGETTILEGLRKELPPGVEVLEHQRAGFEFLNFIEKHKRLIILDKDTSNYAKRTVCGEVEYWGHFTGAIPEEVVVIGMDSVQESLTHILECLERWNN